QALSYLRGPLTREDVSRLMKPMKQRMAAGAPTAPAPSAPTTPARVPATPKTPAAIPMAIPLCRACQGELPPGAQSCPRCGAVIATPKTQDQAFKETLQKSAAPVVARPVPNPPDLPDVAQLYLPPPPRTTPTQQVLFYQARLVGVADVQFLEKKKNL